MQAHWSDLDCSLFLYRSWARNGFYISKWLKKSKEDPLWHVNVMWKWNWNKTYCHLHRIFGGLPGGPHLWVPGARRITMVPLVSPRGVKRHFRHGIWKSIPDLLCQVCHWFHKGTTNFETQQNEMLSPDKDFHLLINWTPLLLLHFEPSSLKIMEVYFSFVSS